METPIRLTTTHKLWVFLGKITKNRLCSIFKEWDPLVLGTIEMVLGKEFMISTECYRTKLDIASRFVVTLLDLELPKVMVLLMTRKLVMAYLLGGVEDVIIIVELGVGIPRSHDLARVFLSHISVKRYHFLLDIKGHDLEVHKERARCEAVFLKVFLYLDRCADLLQVPVLPL